MSEASIFLVVMIGAVVLSATNVVLIWLWARSSERHLITVLDRFLSRNMSEYGMTDLIRREVEADQQSESTDDELDEGVLADWLADRQKNSRGGEEIEVVG